MQRASPQYLLEVMDEPEENEMSLVKAALILAREEYPDIEVEHYVQELDGFAQRLKRRLPEVVSLGDAVFALNQFLFDEQGFTAAVTDYDDPSNSFFNRVMDRRRGIPLSLSMLYLVLGRRIGLPLQGVPFPGHFLVKISLAGEALFLDPFAGGMSLSLEDLRQMLSQIEPQPPAGALKKLLAPATRREMVVRMLRNLKLSFMRRAQLQKALWALDRLLLLVPARPVEIRERAELYEQLDYLPGAIADYKRYLELVPSAGDVSEVRKRVADLRHSPFHLH